MDEQLTERTCKTKKISKLCFLLICMVETFYLHLDFASKIRWSINLPFLCSKCGKCCTIENFLTAGKLNANSEDYTQIQIKAKMFYEEMGKMWAEDEAKYNTYIMTNYCPFLKNNSCTIYEIRPDGCQLFPKTLFGINDKNCMSLNRFKKMYNILKKGKKFKENFRYMGKNSHMPNYQETIEHVHFTEKQYQTCITKLHRVGATTDELALFDYLNGKNKSYFKD